MRIILSLFLAILATTANAASSITITISITGNPDVSRTYSLSDADAARIPPAYQQGANISVNGTATRPQVLRYMIQTWIDGTREKITNFETNSAVQSLPTVTPINPQ